LDHERITLIKHGGFQLITKPFTHTSRQTGETIGYRIVHHADFGLSKKIGFLYVKAYRFYSHGKILDGVPGY
jgi:hypothetical protein